MLNRRVLRIKGMQTLFAYYQAKEANFLLAKDYISKHFQPNLNLDVPENKIEMAEKEKEALELFSKWKENKDTEIQSIEPRIENTVNEAIAYLDDLIQKDNKNLSTRMLIEIENLYSLYFLIIKLLLEIGELNSNTKFIRNTVLPH